MSFVFVEEKFIQGMTARLRRADGPWQRVRSELAARAAEAARRGPWTVTADRSPEPTAGPHDFYSQAPYWWPDPADPAAPYVRRDGERNPGRFMAHWNGLVDLSKTTLYLCAAGRMLGEPGLLDRAAELLRVWFIDPKTRMNPHLQFGEAIIGRCTGRSAGIIAARQIDRIVHSLGYLEGHRSWRPHEDAMKRWLADMLAWLTTSEIGVGESRSGNNHATWWTTHTAAFAAHVGDRDRLAASLRHFREVIVPQQIQPDGSCPRELARTRSMHYSLFNLDAMACLCELARLQGEDLWRFAAADGRGIGLAISFMVPFVDNPYLWEHAEIDGEVPEDLLSFQLASVRLDMNECRRVNAKRLGNRYLVRGQDPLGPLAFFPGFAFPETGDGRLGAF